MEGGDLGLPGSDGAGKTCQLDYDDAVCPAVEAVQGGAGRQHAVAGVDSAEQLLALPGGDDLAGGISRGQAGP
jgi:hypothetical protein